MLIKNWKKEIWTIPNLLSLFRLLLIPVYIFLYLNADCSADYFLAAGILAVSCLTDLIDGKIARQFNMVSTTGKILDPLADKLTQLTLILCLIRKYPFLWYLMALFTIKEGFQMIAGCIHLHNGKMLRGALWSGKLCTAVLFISLIVLVMLPNLKRVHVIIITIIDMLFMTISFCSYIYIYYFGGSNLQSIDSIADDGSGAD